MRILLPGLLLLVALASAPARAEDLVVSSNVRGATILLDGMDTGLKTPATIVGLVPGSYSVVVANECSRGEAQVTVYEGLPTRTSILTSATPGTLIIEMQQEGATVTVDDEKAAAGVPLSLSCGTHTARVSLDGHVPVDLPVEIKGGATTRLPVKLQAVGMGHIELTVTPRIAEITFDGKVVGSDAVTLPSVFEGEHSVGAQSEGYQTATRTIRVEGGDNLVYHIELRRSGASKKSTVTGGPDDSAPTTTSDTLGSGTSGAGDRAAELEASRKATEAMAKANEAERKRLAEEAARKAAEEAAERAEADKAAAVEAAAKKATEEATKKATEEASKKAAADAAAKKASEEANKKAEAEKKAAADAAAKKAAEEASKKAEAEKKAAADAAAKKAMEEAQKLIEVERKAREEAEKKAEAERLAREQAEAEAEAARLAREEAEAEAEAARQAKADAAAAADAAKKAAAAESARKAAEAAAAKKAKEAAEAKAESERAAREKAEKAAADAEAEAEAEEKEADAERRAAEKAAAEEKEAERRRSAAEAAEQRATIKRKSSFTALDGVGVAAMGVGAATGVGAILSYSPAMNAYEEWDDLVQLARTTGDPQDTEEATVYHDDVFIPKVTTYYVLMGATAVLLVGGTVAVVVDDVGAGFVPAPGGGSLTLTGRF